jgi:2,5-diamino-6-(ribosylamino)-4(3H)-pyrimidinone 5'-phosphate reductase
MKRATTLPFVFINVAATVDGKLAPSSRNFVAFSSQRDQRLLLELRSKADAVMAGARTVDLGPVDLGPGPARYRKLRVNNGLAEYNLRVVISGSASLNPDAEIFQRRFSPIIVITTGSAPKARVKRLSGVADEVKIFGESEVDFVEALSWLGKEHGVKRLVCEGGGEVNAGLFRQGMVDQVCLTLSPLIFGGRAAPTMVDGSGVAAVSEATLLHLESLRRFGSELFLVYRVRRKRKSETARVIRARPGRRPLIP